MNERRAIGLVRRAIPPLLLAALALPGTLALQGCGEPVVKLRVKLVTVTCTPGVAAIDPLRGPGGLSVTRIRVRAYHVPQDGQPDFEAFSYDREAPWDDGGATLSGIPVGRNRHLVVEGYAGNALVARGDSGPLTLDGPGRELELVVQMRRVDAFTPTASLGADGASLPCTRMRLPRRAHTSTLLSDGRVLVAGGYRAEAGAVFFESSTEIFDPRSGTFSDGPALPTQRAFHTATRVPGTRLILFAGGQSSFATEGAALDSADVYDEETGRFTTVPMLKRRIRHAAVAAPGGLVLLVGGNDVVEPDPMMAALDVPHISTEVFDPQRMQFLEGPDLSSSRTDIGALALPSGLVVIAGGYDGVKASDVVEVFRFEGGTYRRGGGLETRLSQPRIRPRLGAIGDLSVIVVGGQSAAATAPDGSPPPNGWLDTAQYTKALATTETVTFESNGVKVAFGPTLRQPRLSGGLVALAEGTLLVSGGAAYSGSEFSAVFDAETIVSADGVVQKQEAVAAGLRQGRFHASYVLLRDGTVLVTGGATVDSNRQIFSLSSAELYQPAYRAGSTNPYR